MAERLMQIPLLDQAAAEIAGTGQFQRQLTEVELMSLVNGVMGSLLSGQGNVRAEIERMKIKIAQNQGLVDGSLLVQSPISAQIGIRWLLANDPNSSRTRIATIGLDVLENPHGFRASIALAAVNVRSKAEDALYDPNAALYRSLDSQLRARGVAIAGQSLQFVDNTLFVGLSGRPLSR